MPARIVYCSKLNPAALDMRCCLRQGHVGDCSFIQAAGRYYPAEGSLARRVLDFFSANPEEHLSANDVIIKFSPRPGNVHVALRPLVLAGVLEFERMRTDDRFCCYRLPKAAL